MIVVDVETTGLDPSLHSIVSIGAVDFADPTRQFYRECRPWDGARVESTAVAINGFSVAQLSDPARPSLHEVLREFVAWSLGATDVTLAGHNPSFDVGFLRAATARYDIPWPFGFRFVDLHSICWAHMSRRAQLPQASGLKSRLIYGYVGLPEEPKPHHGLTGAKMEAEAFARLISSRPLLDEFAGHPVPEYL